MFILARKKRCSKCCESKPVEEFGQDKSRRDGLRCWCKQCKRESDRRWKQDHPERAREAVRCWCEANRDRVREKNRCWKKAHPDKVREHNRLYREAHPDRERDRIRHWRKANPDKHCASSQRHRAKKFGNGGSYTAQEWKVLCDHQANRCACCGEKKPLTVDHILPLDKGGKNDIGNIQALCLSCNQHKGTKTIDYRSD